TKTVFVKLNNVFVSRDRRELHQEQANAGSAMCESMMQIDRHVFIRFRFGRHRLSRVANRPCHSGLAGGRGFSKKACSALRAFHKFFFTRCMEKSDLQQTRTSSSCKQIRID